MGIDTVFSEIVSDKVTEEEWNAAFCLNENRIPVNAENYKYVFRYYDEVTYEVCVDDNKIYMKISVNYGSEYHGVNTVEYYYEMNEDSGERYGGWEYSYAIGAWVKNKDYREGYKCKMMFAFCYSGVYEGWEHNPETNLTVLPMFDYSEEAKGYVRTSSDEYGEYAYVTKFQNGKYCGFEEYFNGELAMSAIVYDYGKSKVSLPKVAE